MASRRALHFVFKVGNRTETAKFYRDVLGMKFLRHEEFEEGCKASCNGPYDGKWSKSMVGYGPEDSHFVVELTYNYGIGSYKLGNDFLGLTIHSTTILDKAKQLGYPITSESGLDVLTSPDGYKFKIVNKTSEGDPVKQVTLASSDLSKSVDYWSRLCGMKIFSQQEKSALLGYDDKQCKLELIDIGTSVDHATAFGRIAFSCPSAEVQKHLKDMLPFKSKHEAVLYLLFLGQHLQQPWSSEGFLHTGHLKYVFVQHPWDFKALDHAYTNTTWLPALEEKIKAEKQTILTPLVSLDTPGKATVQVVILADPDGHEICFVGDEAFRELSQVDPAADKLLDEAVAADKSDEWFAKKGKSKGVA